MSNMTTLVILVQYLLSTLQAVSMRVEQFGEVLGRVRD